MKIIRIIARLNIGGPAQHVTWLTAAFVRAGHRALLVTGTVSPGELSMDELLRTEQVTPVMLGKLGRELSLADIAVVWKLFALFVHERPDVIHTHTAKAGAVGRAAALVYRLVAQLPWNRWPRPLVVHTYHGHVFHSYFGRVRTWVFLTIERVLARIATDRIVVISTGQLDEIHRTFGVGRASQFAVVPLGFNLTPFVQSSVLRSATRSTLGLREADVAIGIVGRLTEVKDHTLFLSSAAHLVSVREGSTAPKFVVVGDGHLRAKIEATANELGLGPRIQFLGDRGDMGALYAAFDIVALTSLNEGTPLSLLEAMASARPVVSTAVGGVPDLVGAPIDASDVPDGVTVHERGLLVRSRDPRVFAAAVRYLESRPALREILGASGRGFVEANHSVQRLVDDILRLYQGSRQASYTGAHPTSDNTNGSRN